ncbi:GNAT family N-acetyltransferase [Stappia sp. BW2]|jgi:predicted N-acetyltransferase YhbS|nr:GNAT family N-acetyltransferase [Stappia sp. BW2]
MARWSITLLIAGSEALGPSKKNQIDAFSMHIADVQDADLDQLHALSISVGWPHRGEDWQFLREVGEGVVTNDEIGRIMGSAMWYRQAESLATIGMVITSPRLQTQGTGLWLMEYALNELEGCNLRLNATRAAQRLYHSLGFTPEKTVFQCQGVVKDGAGAACDAPQGDLRVLTKDDLPAITALDGAAFGVERAGLIDKLLAQSVGYGLYRDGVLTAFALCRRFGRGHVVGPIVASNDADAIDVLSPHIKEHEGRFLRLDTHFESGDFAHLVTGSGMSVFDTVLTMSLGERLRKFGTDVVEGPVTYSLVSQTLG